MNGKVTVDQRCAIYGSLVRTGIHGSRKVVACAICGFGVYYKSLLLHY